MAIYLCLDELLKERGMSVSKLALEVGITRANVSNIKTGNIKALRFSTLDKLCEVLNCEPGDIIKYKPSSCEESDPVETKNEEEIKETEELQKTLQRMEDEIYLSDAIIKHNLLDQ